MPDRVPAARPPPRFAADGITRISTFLSSGRTVPAALRDNVFAVSVPQVELPARLVGYDRRGRVAALQTVPGSGVARPCPPATFTTPTTKLTPPKPWERIDLATMRVNGHDILGRTPAQVEAALGTPTDIRHNAQIDNGVPVPELRYGGTLPSTTGLSISFTRHGRRVYANTMTYQSPSLIDRKLGHVLREQPARLQQQIATTYGSTYRAYIRYGSQPLLGCTASFRDLHNLAGIAIGLNPHRPSRPYLTLRTNGGG